MLNWILARPRSERIGLGLLVISGLLAVWLGFFAFEPKEAVTLVHRGGYYWVLLCVALFSWSFFKTICWPVCWRKIQQGGWRVGLLIVLVSAWVHIVEPHGFKVVNDEILLVSASQRMHDRREAGTVARGYTIGSEYTVMQGYMDKRPSLYPFLVSLLHDATGYRPENAFVLNVLLTPVFLALLFLVAKQVAGRMAGYAAILLWITLPLFVQISTGAGFELLNLVMILAVIYSCFVYARSRSGDALNTFVFSVVLLGQVRYESILYVLPVAVAILYLWALERKIHVTWGLLISPMLLVVYALQANVAKISPAVLQLQDRASGHGVYSLRYFYDNVGAALAYFLSFDKLHANSHLVLVVGVAGLGFYFMYLYRCARSSVKFEPVQMVWFVWVLALLAQSFLMLCYFWGDYTDMITVRLSLPTQLLFVLVFAGVYALLISHPRRWLGLYIAAIAYFIIWTAPTVFNRGYASVNFAAEFNNWCGRFASGLRNRDAFVIDPASRVWSLYEVPCVALDGLASRVDGFLFHMDRGTFRECLVIQRLEISDIKTGAMLPLRTHDFGSALELETVAEVRYSPTYVMRVSKVKSYNAEALREWGANYNANAKRPGRKSDDLLSPLEQVAYAREWMRQLP